MIRGTTLIHDFKSPYNILTRYNDLTPRVVNPNHHQQNNYTNKLNEEKITFYIGTDPTADSMHIGHFSSFLIASRLAKYGHKCC